jgi:hypothetical protein
MLGLCIMVAGVALLGCSDATVYTLYRNSVVIENARLHVATFDTADGEPYNSENCQAARDLFQQQPGVKTRFLVRERKIPPVTCPRLAVDTASGAARGGRGLGLGQGDDHAHHAARQRPFHCHRARRRADEVQDPARGERLVQDAPSWLADHGGWPRRQASATQETGALTRPAAEPAQAFFRLLVQSDKGRRL